VVLHSSYSNPNPDLNTTLTLKARTRRHAEASDDGRLVYVFPHLQLTAEGQAEGEAGASSMGEGGQAESSAAAAVRRRTPPLAAPPLPPPVYEKQWPLLAGGLQQVCALECVCVLCGCVGVWVKQPWKQQSRPSSPMLVNVVRQSWTRLDKGSRLGKL